MRTQGFGADTIDEAAEGILQVLNEKTRATRTVSSRDNVFYFDGWDGLGASAVLRAIAQRLTTTSADGKRALAELGFDQVIHIDCSMWESRRALQRAVAEQLKLPHEVMELFDREDEKDDFRGVAQGSRAELQQVVREMHQHIKKLDVRFLVVFHNGSSEEIDLASLCGFPLSGYSTSKVLWTFQGRFRLKPRTKVDMAMKKAGTTDVFLSEHRNLEIPEKLWFYLVLQEAEEVVAACKINTGYPQERMPGELWPYLVLQDAMEVAKACKVNTEFSSTIDQPEQVSECFLYMWELCCRGIQSVDYDLGTHGTNYWVCDGIMHQQRQQGQRDDGLWRAAEALQFEMPLDVDYHQYLLSPHLATFVKSKPFWSSPTCGFTRISDGAISSGGMFQHYADKLRVLKLFGCTIDFQSPPFLCCHSLRFLWLDNCHGTRTSTDVAGKEEDIRRCFQRLGSRRAPHRLWGANSKGPGLFFIS